MDGRKPEPRRFPRPWRAERSEGGYVVKDATGLVLCILYARDIPSSYGWHGLTVDEARRIANGISRLPELMQAQDVREAIAAMKAQEEEKRDRRR